MLDYAIMQVFLMFGVAARTLVSWCGLEVGQCFSMCEKKAMLLYLSAGSFVCFVVLIGVVAMLVCAWSSTRLCICSTPASQSCLLFLRSV